MQGDRQTAPDDKTRKRILGIARHWQRQFKLNYDMLDDVMSMAWVAWFERPTVEAERRFQQVFNAVRRSVLRELWGKCPHASKAPQETVFQAETRVVVDFYSRVRLREIVDACAQAKLGLGHNSDHLRTIAIHAGLQPRSRSESVRLGREFRLRKFLREKGLVAMAVLLIAATALAQTSPDGTVVPPGRFVIDSNGQKWELGSGNGKSTGAPDYARELDRLAYCGGVVYGYNTPEKLWYRGTSGGPWTLVGPNDPCVK